MTLVSSNALEAAPFSLFPEKRVPTWLAKCYKKSLVESLEVYLKKTSESLKVDLAPLLKKNRSLNLDESFSPAFFVYYDLLKEGYEQKIYTKSLTPCKPLKI